MRKENSFSSRSFLSFSSSLCFQEKLELVAFLFFIERVIFINGIYFLVARHLYFLLVVVFELFSALFSRAFLFLISSCVHRQARSCFLLSNFIDHQKTWTFSFLPFSLLLEGFFLVRRQIQSDFLFSSFDLSVLFIVNFPSSSIATI